MQSKQANKRTVNPVKSGTTNSGRFSFVYWYMPVIATRLLSSFIC